ncbi:hypothetical protein EV201_3182 [Ancylomarina subtilis]|uniref:Uncharacterized protein n=1 Tax=Ancylomarina subtilis TaxID=1639035 RepID=A0A4Q7V719_9BACT|nr:hypothetical protein [Ancylomarina subtilis]RZT91367.1 hypothetical protein EV201_3182 [Ancylomarina subtilis]
MIKFKRHIKVDGEVFETWMGLDIKKKGGRPNVSVYYYTDDPELEMTAHHLIKANFQSKDEAVKHGCLFMRAMYKDMIKREKGLVDKSEEEDEVDW